MESLDECEARAILLTPHRVEGAEAEDWQLLDKPKGAFEFEQGLVDEHGKNAGLVVSLHFYRSPKTQLITVKMSVFRQVKRQPPLRVYQLHITTQSYDPQNWHDEAHEHIGKGRYLVQQWHHWRSFGDVLQYFCQQTNITFDPELHDPEHLRLQP